MGWSSGAAGGWDDPVVGGTILRVPAIQSPGFQTGVQGWIIRSDGSAEFNNAIFRGTVVISSATQSLLVYNGTPANGNLILSIAAVGGTDSFGNTYLQGLAGYNTSGTFTVAGSLTNESTRFIQIQSDDANQLITFSPKLGTWNSGTIRSTTANGHLTITAPQLATDAGNGVVITLSPANPSGGGNAQVDLAADLISITAAGQTDIINTAWTSFNTTWSGSVSNPAIGNGTSTAAYLQIGKIIHFRIHLHMGTTTTFGSGAYGFTLPFAPIDDQAAAAVFVDSSASQRWPGAAWLTNGSGVFRVLAGAGGNVGISSAVPFAWASGDELIITGVYEKA